MVSVAKRGPDQGVFIKMDLDVHGFRILDFRYDITKMRTITAVKNRTACVFSIDLTLRKL